jgi:hypothetical protein
LPRKTPSHLFAFLNILIEGRKMIPAARLERNALKPASYAPAGKAKYDNKNADKRSAS